MGEYLHRSVHDNYAARHKGWYDNGGSMSSILSQEGAPAGERIARSKYQSAQVGAILGVGDGARTNRKRSGPASARSTSFSRQPLSVLTNW